MLLVLAATMSSPAIEFRPGNQYDMPFVRSSWFESYRKGGCAPEMGFDAFNAEFDHLQRRILRYAEVTIAYPRGLPEGDDTICGYVVHNGNVVHYVYVKQVFRKRGIAKALVGRIALPRKHTFETVAGRRLASQMHSAFNPYLLFHLDPLDPVPSRVTRNQ